MVWCPRVVFAGYNISPAVFASEEGASLLRINSPAVIASVDDERLLCSTV